MADREMLRSTFATATAETLRVMAGVEAVPLDGAGEFRGDLFASVQLVGSPIRRFALAFPAATAEALAQRILDDPIVSNAMIRDCMGEIANVVAGQAKAMLFGTPEHFTFSLPTVSNEMIAEESTVVQQFGCEVGVLSFCVDYRPHWNGFAVGGAIHD